MLEVGARAGQAPPLQGDERSRGSAVGVELGWRGI